MTLLLLSFLSWFSAFFCSRHHFGLELAALRQQVGILKRQNPRPQWCRWDRLFWLTLRRLGSGWASALLIVKPETVVSWHRAGFRWYWRFLSRHRSGRPKITPEFQKLIRSMAAENPTWGAPRIYGELLKLGFEISEGAVSRYLGRRASPRDANKRWLTFLKTIGRRLRRWIFHRADGNLSGALLLLRDQPRPSENLALQRDGTSH
jgi:putative transposase